MTSDVVLRDVTETDLPILFEQQLDSAANQMAAFTAKDPADRAAFAAKWAQILDDDSITKRTVLFGGRGAGSVSAFGPLGRANSKSRTGSEENSGAKGLPPRRSRGCWVP